jgi:hypothetical protein
MSLIEMERNDDPERQAFLDSLEGDERPWDLVELIVGFIVMEASAAIAFMRLQHGGILSVATLLFMLGTGWLLESWIGKDLARMDRNNERRQLEIARLERKVAELQQQEEEHD